MNIDVTRTDIWLGNPDHPLFEKANEVKNILLTEGYIQRNKLSGRFSAARLRLTKHFTKYGNSAYLTTRKTGKFSYIEHGFRLSDHPVGERRKQLMKQGREHPEILYRDDITTRELLDLVLIDDDKIPPLDARVIALDIKRDPVDPSSCMLMSEHGVTNKERHQENRRIFDIMVTRIPEWKTFDKPRKQKVKKAFFENYQLDVELESRSNAPVYHICKPESEHLQKWSEITTGWPNLMLVNCSFSTLEDVVQCKKSGTTGNIIAEEQGQRRILTTEEQERILDLMNRIPKFEQEQEQEQERKNESELEFDM